MAIEHRLAPISEAELAKKCDNLVAGDDGCEEEEEEDNSNHSRDQIKPKITTREDVNKFISALLTRLQRTSFFVFVLSDIASPGLMYPVKEQGYHLGLFCRAQVGSVTFTTEDWNLLSNISVLY